MVAIDDDRAVEAMVCDISRVEIDWLVFLAGVAAGWIILMTAIRLGVGSSFIRYYLSRDEEELESLRTTYVSIADATSVSLDVNDTDKESLAGFDIIVTSKVLGALKDHLQNIDIDQEIESLGKLHISYEPNKKANDDQLDLSSVLRRWSLPSENCSASSPSTESARKRNSCCCSSDMAGNEKKYKRPGRASVTFEDGINPSDCCDENCPVKKFKDSHVDFDIRPVGEAKIEIVSEESWFAEEADIIQAQEFDDRVLSKICSLEESRMYLRRTRAVSMLSSRLMAAPDEKSCYEIVSRLLVPLFHVDRISYVLMKDSEHMLVKQITVNKQEHMVMGLDKGFLGGGRWEDEGYIKPLKGTAVEECSKTLKPHYCPNIKDSPFETQRQISTMGVNTILATPILVNGNKFIGCIMICMVEQDAFNEFDRILIQDIAKKLGVNIYAKRIKHAAEQSSKISREMLHSMIPQCVIEKISCFWDESSLEFQRRRSSANSSSISSTPKSRRSSFSRINSDDSCSEKIQLLSKMYRQNSSGEEIGTLLDSNESDFPLTTTKALYAENVDDVCIVFADIVGFSRISMELEPFVVVNMLQDLFSRFDDLCDVHNVQKLETIGDAYICTAGIDRSNGNGDNIKDSAVRTLNMAKDMVSQARHVLIPTPGGLGKNSKLFDSLEIRVGIHVGNVTCGVLGQRLPKMTVFGNAVNLSARMEQTSLPSHIRVTKDFYDLVADVEDQWEACEEIEIKNMGTVDTYLLNPLKTLHLQSI